MASDHHREYYSPLHANGISPGSLSYAALDPYAAATATLEANDPHGLFISDWDGLYEPEDQPSTAKDLVVYAAVQFLATAIASPLEVATILRQVQFLPSDAYLERYSKTDAKPHSESDASSESDAGEVSDDSDAERTATEEDFHHSEPRRYAKSVIERTDEIAAADATTGYLLVAHSEGNNTTRAPYQLPPLEGSSLSIMGEIASKNDEGLSSLWKGQTPAWAREISHSLLQPAVHLHLTTTLHSHSPTHLDSPLQRLLVTAGSHTLSSLILSPFDLIRTRLVVQTANPYHRKYRGPFHCLWTMVAEEGWRGVFFGRHFLPTLLLHTIAPLFQFSREILVQAAADHPSAPGAWALGAFELSLKIVELVFTMPLTTVQRRLMCQINPPREPEDRVFEPCVERNPIPYSSLLDCAGRIVMEEGGARSRPIRGGGRGGTAKRGGGDERSGRQRRRRGDPRLRRPAGERTWWSSWGLSGLYRGFGLRVVSSIASIAMTTVAGYLDEPDGDAEGLSI
ncbi:hypothetical protein HDU89_008479 [Geranomyces variabilis]|nr:hypothetical protein HDU89_008479 [Geranomyces variabilis]